MAFRFFVKQNDKSQTLLNLAKPEFCSKGNNLWKTNVRQSNLAAKRR